MKVAIVAAMGFAGALLRFLISEAWGTVNGFPIATLAINLAGCFLLGWFYTVSVDRMYVSPLLRLGIGTGFLGAFTTFSTFVVEAWKLTNAGLISVAEAYVLLTVFGSLTFAWLGTVAGSRSAGRSISLERQ